MRFKLPNQRRSLDAHPVPKPLADVFPAEEPVDSDDYQSQAVTEVSRISEDANAEPARRSRRPSVASVTSIGSVSSMRSMAPSQILNTQLDKLRRRSAVLSETFVFLEGATPGTFAFVFSKAMQSMIVASVFFTLFQTIPNGLSNAHQSYLIVFETIFDVVFTVEVCVRFIVYPDHYVFFLSPYNCIDLIAGIPPLIFRAISGFTYPSETQDQFAYYFLADIVPTLRLLKLLRRFEMFHLLLSAFKISLEALPFLLYILLLAVLVFSSMVFIVEPRYNIPSLPWAMWLTIMSVTTIGYGDIFPVTGAGRIIISGLSIFSTMYMAVPLGIIGNSFSQVWADRNQRLLTHRFRIRLFQAGFTASDIPELFYVYDLDKDGYLSLPEFRNMIADIHAGLSEDDIKQLFEVLDADGNGSIDDYEFVHSIWPHSAKEIYQGLLSQSPVKERADLDAQQPGSPQVPETIGNQDIGP